jgi:hypothetical protein
MMASLGRGAVSVFQYHMCLRALEFTLNVQFRPLGRRQPPSCSDISNFRVTWSLAYGGLGRGTSSRALREAFLSCFCQVQSPEGIQAHALNCVCVIAAVVSSLGIVCSDLMIPFMIMSLKLLNCQLQLHCKKSTASGIKFRVNLVTSNDEKSCDPYSHGGRPTTCTPRPPEPWSCSLRLPARIFLVTMAHPSRRIPSPNPSHYYAVPQSPQNQSHPYRQHRRTSRSNRVPPPSERPVPMPPRNDLAQGVATGAIGAGYGPYSVRLYHFQCSFPSMESLTV